MSSWRICISRFAQFLLIICCLLELSMKACSATESNVTRSILNDEDEEGEREEDITFAEFKERYRRLIPYMAFYAANNNLNGQSVIPGKNFLNVPSSNEDVTSSRRSQQYQPLFSRTNVGTRNILNNYRTNNNNNNNLQNQLRKFVPSVQYDPNGDINGDTDYFIPIRYNTKVNHVDYYSSSTYNPYQDQKQSHQEVTKTNIDDNVQKDDRRYGRPIRPYLSTGNTREYVNRNQGLKPIQTNFPQDYAYDHVSGSSSKGKPIVDINYPSEDVDSLRYIPQAVISKGTQQTINLLDTPPPPPPLPPPNARQPVNVAPQRNLNFINLNPIIESFQLTERLPETLDKNNLDNSIKTLIEILNILHKAKIEEFPQLPQSSFSGLPSVTVRPIQRPSNYYQKLRPNTRPKVITESRFPAVPTSLLIPDDPDRLKPTSSYVNEVKAKVIVKPVAYTVDDFKSTPSYKDNEFRLVTPKLPVQSSYTFTDENDDKKVVHFQTPYAPQDISQQNDNNDNNNNNKNPLEISTQHSYEITEDLSDDIIDPDRFTIPQIITETTTAISQKQNVLEQNEISTSRPTINHPSLKYGVTRGKPNVDYPAYAVIPETEFSCKKQRYKGFFGDPSTGCQVWHYCDLNGGKSSFLCPNGTIFSQVALTCDWWFNVKCESTTQLYVLNERLYKYILPIMPKFPEDFTGPEVDRYLEIKFKEMEAKLKEKKLKKQQERKDKAKGKVQPIDDNSNKNRE